MSDTIPKSMSHLPADVRLELLVGHLSDLLGPAHEIAGALRLQANASVTHARSTRSSARVERLDLGASRRNP